MVNFYKTAHKKNIETESSLLVESALIEPPLGCHLPYRAYVSQDFLHKVTLNDLDD